jgi:hypothetical protein
MHVHTKEELAVWTHLSASKGSSKQTRYGSFRPSLALVRFAASSMPTIASGSVILATALLRDWGTVGGEGDIF